MNNRHYKNQLSAFVDQELSKEERQAVAEHLLVCDDCRREHDELKLGAKLAGLLPQKDAPSAVWNAIETELDSPAPKTIVLPEQWGFSFKNLAAFATAILIVSAVSILVYRGLFLPDPNETASRQTPADHTATQEPKTQPPDKTDAPYFQFETIAGAPMVGDSADVNKLAVGEYLETDASSRVRIEVADIGSVEVAPNSRVKLVGTAEDEHRLSLEHGGLHARIFAPPRLFIVDTPSGKAVDLGCEYTLEVDKEGNSKLHVTGGFVSLEDGGHESYVPAGAMCLTRKGKGIGTPFSTEATKEFQAALMSFDFDEGGSHAVDQIVKMAKARDALTLWHLLSRTSLGDREKVFDKLSKLIPPPQGTTKAGILNLNKQMLDDWRIEVEIAWFN